MTLQVSGRHWRASRRWWVSVGVSRYRGRPESAVAKRQAGVGGQGQASHGCGWCQGHWLMLRLSGFDRSSGWLQLRLHLHKFHKIIPSFLLHLQLQEVLKVVATVVQAFAVEATLISPFMELDFSMEKDIERRCLWCFCLPFKKDKSLTKFDGNVLI